MDCLTRLRWDGAFQAAAERLEPGAIELVRKGCSAIKRFFLGSTTAAVCQYAEKLPVWVVGYWDNGHILDESERAER